ncbi:hypothetical protein ACFL47_03440 [Candidatus Latescibacterota bacterium]
MIRPGFAGMILIVIIGCSGGLTEVSTGDYDSLIKSGWDKYNDYKYDESSLLFANAKKSDETRPEGYIGSGWTLLRLQEPYSAIVEFRDAFQYITSVNDSVDAICGLAGAYLATGDNTQVINQVKKYPVSSYDDAFPFRKHDFFITQGDLEIVQAVALYRLGVYTPAEQADPDNALYHINQALYKPYEYSDPQSLMAEITKYLNQSTF